MAVTAVLVTVAALWMVVKVAVVVALAALSMALAAEAEMFLYGRFCGFWRCESRNFVVSAVNNFRDPGEEFRME